MMLAVFLLASSPLTQTHIDLLSDAQLCQAAQEVTAMPSLQVEDVGPIDFQQWEVECEAKLLRIQVRLLDSRLTEDLLVDHFRQPGFCQAPNLQRFWQRGWRFEMRFVWADGRVRDIPTCG